MIYGMKIDKRQHFANASQAYAFFTSLEECKETSFHKQKEKTFLFKNIYKEQTKKSLVYVRRSAKKIELSFLFVNLHMILLFSFRTQYFLFFL